MVAADQFGFAFCKVKGGAVGFSAKMAVVKRSRRHGMDEDVPLGNDAAKILGLRFDHGFEIERADRKQHGHEREGERHFVGEHLGRGAEAAEKGVFLEPDAQPPRTTP